MELQFLVLSKFKATVPANRLQISENLARHKINHDELLTVHFDIKILDFKTISAPKQHLN